MVTGLLAAFQIPLAQIRAAAYPPGQELPGAGCPAAEAGLAAPGSQAETTREAGDFPQSIHEPGSPRLQPKGAKQENFVIVLVVHYAAEQSNTHSCLFSSQTS